MNVRRTWAIARKEFLHVLRDPLSLGMAVLIPMIMLILFGYALTFDVDNVPLYVWDQSETPASRELISRFGGSPYFSIRGYVQGYRAIEDAIDHSRATTAGLIIPRGFAADAGGGRETAVQLIIDGSDANTATLAQSYAQVVVTAYAQNVALNALGRLSGQTITLSVDPRPRVWFNADMRSTNYIVPGLIAVIMMVITAQLTSLTVAREWERGTMEQLISTPIRGPELIVGKLAPYFTVGMIDVLLAVLMGEFLFHVPLRGSVLLVFAMAALFLVGVLSMGVLISTIARNQLLASQSAMMFTYLPAFLLSGFMIPIVNMPKPIQLVTYIVPARYFVALLRGIYLKGLGLDVLAGHALLLAVFGALMLTMTILCFRKKLA